MRSVAFLAALLLVFALALRFESRAIKAQRESLIEKVALRPHSIQVFSAGSNVPAPLHGARELRLGTYVDGTWYRSMRGGAGLGVTTIPADGSSPVSYNFNLRKSEGEIAKFENLLSNLPINTVLALSVFRDITQRWGAPDARARNKIRIGRILRGLGAKMDPTDTDTASFAYLCIRRPQGFVALAESYSTTRGVTLSFLLEADRTAYDDRKVHTLIDDRTFVELAPADATGKGLRAETAKRFHNIAYAAVGAPVRKDNPALMTWNIAEGAGLEGPLGLPLFTARYAVAWSDGARPEAYRLVLHVNGKPASARVVYTETGIGNRWHLWEQPLGGFREGIDRVEVEVEWIGDEGERAGYVYVGNVRIELGRIESI